MQIRWGGLFDIDKKKIELQENEAKTQAPDFWNDPKEAELFLKKISATNIG